MINTKEACEKIVNRIIEDQTTTTSNNFCSFCGLSGDDLERGRGNTWIHPRCYENARIAALREGIKDELSKRGVRKRFLDCTFENFKTHNESLTNAKAKTESITTEFNGSIFLTSADPGTGKTHLAVATMRNLICLYGVTDIQFVSSPYLFLEIKNSYSGSESESNVINKYCGYSFLIIDDIGVERVSDWALQIWYMIIDRRYSEMLPTIYTSNLSIGQIADSLGDRIASRLSSGLVITINSDDYRLKNRKRN